MPKRFIVLLLTMVIPAVVGLMKIYEGLSRKKPDVVAELRIEEATPNLPYPVRNLLDLVDRLRRPSMITPEVPQYLSELGDRLRREYQPPLEPNPVEFVEKGTWLFRKFAESDPPVRPGELHSLLVHNRGSRTAKDVRVTIRSSGFFEIYPTIGRNAPISGETDKEIPLGALNPGERKTVIFWPDSDLEDPLNFTKVTFDDEQARVVRERTVDTIENYVIEIPRTYFSAAAIIILVIGITAFALMSRVKRTARVAIDR